MNKLSLGLFLASFLLGIFGYRFFKSDQSERGISLSQAEPSPFVLKPPSAALAGQVIKINGEVNKQPRDKEGLLPVEDGQSVYQAENVLVGAGSSAEVLFPRFAQLNLGENSEIDLVSLIPESFLVSQKLGQVSYLLLSEDDQLSVKIFELLALINTGESVINIQNGIVEIAVSSGSTRLALIDNDNQTQVWDLAKGDKASIDLEGKDLQIK